MINKIGIIGQGKMGESIFYHLINYYNSIIWVCSNNENSEITENEFIKKTDKMYRRNLIDDNKKSLLLENVKITESIEELSDCDLIIETVNENRELKKEIYSRLKKITPNKCIITTNTSSINLLNITSDKKSNFAGLHFFYPVKLKNYVEINKTPYTGKKTINLLQSFLSNIKKESLLLEPESNFLLNKIFLNLQSESYNISVKHKIPFDDIDNIIKDNIMPIGIFEMMDHIGLDILLFSIKNYIENNSENINRYINLINYLQKLIEHGKVGVKSGEGFFRYSGNKKIISPNENNSNKIDEIFYKNVKFMLIYIYINSFFNYTSSINMNIINNAVKDYLGFDKGPVELSKEFDFTKFI